MLTRPGGPNTMKRYFFVLLCILLSIWAEDTEQINIINNRVKNDKLFPRFLCMKSRFLSRSLSQSHTQYRHAPARTRGEKLVVSAAPRFINKIAFQLKSYMTFLSSEVLEAVQLKYSLL